MIAWLLIILGLIISFCFAGPLGSVIFLVASIVLIIILKILHISFLASIFALKTSAKGVKSATGENYNNKNAAKVSYSSWFILLIILIYCPLLGGLISFFEFVGVKSDSCPIYAVVTSFPIIGVLGFIYKKYKENLYNKMLYTIVKEHFDTLSAKYKELVYISDYGETIYDKWYEELDHFIDGVIKKQKSAFTLSNDELKKRIIKIFDKIYNQTLNQK